MIPFTIKEISNLLEVDLSEIEAESKGEGFQMIGRLLEDYQNCINTFQKPGEVIFGVFNQDGKFLAVGGLYIDPFSNEKSGESAKIFLCRRRFVVRASAHCFLKKSLQMPATILKRSSYIQEPIPAQLFTRKIDLYKMNVIRIQHIHCNYNK